MFNRNVRKSVLALILLALVMPIGRAFAQSAQSTTKSPVSAPVVGGADPEPQVVGGADPEPQINTMQMILILLHLA
jgi:hypothetical protein